MLVELDRIQLDKAATAAVHTRVNDTPFDNASAAPRYAALLRDYGVDPAAPTAAAERVRGSRLRHVLLAALDDWRRVTPDAAEQQQLETGAAERRSRCRTPSGSAGCRPCGGATVPHWPSSRASRRWKGCR